MDRQEMTDEVQAMEFSFYAGKRVLVTGHTGFKGTWLCKFLAMMGAKVLGYALEPLSLEGKQFFSETVGKDVDSRMGDVRDLEHLRKVFEEFRPEIVFHLAAQPIVLESYRDPVGTYNANVMGTVHLMECVRLSDSVRSVVNVTTDKVYENREWEWGYREIDVLDGFDPYSNSKSCSELVTASFRRSFLEERDVAVSTARAGNVIGGGDFSAHRILPDCVRAACRGEAIRIRNPYSVRPYQHVLEPLAAYLLIAERQHGHKELAGSYNVGPEECDCVTTGELATLFCEAWGEGLEWQAVDVNAGHEAQFLRLDCSKIRRMFGWKPVWHIEEAVRRTVEFGKAWRSGDPVGRIVERQIQAFAGTDCSYAKGEIYDTGRDA